MITTVHVAISWPKGVGPKISDRPVEHLSVRDPRVLLGVQQVLAQRMGVTQAPDLVKASPTPYFAVALNDRPDDGGFSERYAVTTLLGWLTEPIQLSVVYAADGGWKTVLVDIDVEVC